MDIPIQNTSTGIVEPSGGDVIRIAQVGRLLRRHAWLVGLLAVIGGAAAYGVATMLPKSYTASASLAVEGATFSIPELQGALRGANNPDPMPLVRTEQQALTSRTMVLQAVNQVGLDRYPEFNPTLRPPNLLDRLKGWVKSLLPAKKGGPQPTTEELVVNAALRALNTFQDNRSLVIDISFTSREPALSAKFLDTLINDYFADRTHRRESANQLAGSDLTQRIAQVRDDLNGIEKKMRDLRVRSGVVGLQTTGSVGQQQLEELATALDRASVERTTLEASWQRAQALAARGDSSAFANVLGSETITRLRDQEGQAASQVAQLSATHGSNYPPLRSAEAQLAAIQGQLGGETRRIVDSLGAQVQVARAHEADLKRQLAETRDTALKSQNVQAELNQLQADATSERQVYQTLLGQAQQAIGPTGKTANEMPDVRMLSGPVPPGLPSAPNMKMSAGLGLVGGALIGCLLAFIRAQREDGFADAEMLEKIAGLQVAATLPRPGRGRRNGLLARITVDPGGVEAEALRLVRARLRGLARAHAVRNVNFTGVGCDADSVAAAFARIAAADGERVLLAEGNLRHPMLGDLIDLDDGVLAQALRGEQDWRDGVDADEETPLDILAAGEAVEDGQMLVGSVAFQNLLMEAREDYTLVVLSAPPIDDAITRTLAQRTDATVVVVDGRHARREELNEQIEHLGALSRSPLLGILIAPV